jgi:hypothetical protein
MVYMLLTVGAGSGGGRATGTMAAMSSGDHQLPVLSVLLAAALLVGVVHAGRAHQGAHALAPAGADDAGDPATTAAVDGTLATRTTATRTEAGTLSVPFLAPRLASACEVAMGVVMIYMLLSML